MTTSAKISLSLFLFLILYFSYIAFTKTPVQINEVDSLYHHIPQATAIARGKIFHPPDLERGLGYYSPIGETILAFFIKFNIPLGLYNILAISILYFLAYKLAIFTGLKRDSAIVYSTSIVSVKSVVSLIPTQKNDIWLDIFYLLVIYLLLKPKKAVKYFVMLGTGVGLLIGVKYSGIAYVIFLFILFSKHILSGFDKLNKLFSFLIPSFLFGFIWFIRNYLVKGNPFYPVTMLGFKGHPEYNNLRGFHTLFDGSCLKINLEAFFSEYLIWSFLPLVFIYLYISQKKYLEIAGKYLIIALFTFLVYLYLPSAFSRTSITSNVRFLHVAFFMMIMSAFVIAKKLNVEKFVQFIAIINSFAIFSQFEYRPKLFLIWMFLCALLFLNNIWKQTHSTLGLK